MPKISRYVYVAGEWAFVPHPCVAGWWLRLHLSVLKVGCSYCGALVGRPCIGRGGEVETSIVHHPRRKEGSAAVPIKLATAGTQFVVGDIRARRRAGARKK